MEVVHRCPVPWEGGDVGLNHALTLDAMLYSCLFCQTMWEHMGRGPKNLNHNTRSLSLPRWLKLAETQCAPTGTVCRRSRGSMPGSTGRFRVRISGAHALRLISRAGKEGSTVSSIICDR